MKTLRTLIGAAVVAALAMTVAGCSGSHAPVTYAPAAYGVAGHCYYVDDPAEVAALQRAGLCPAAWVATPMPLAWHEEYYDYYDSSAYYDTYVPVATRTVYVHRQATFRTAHRAAITASAKKATYRSSSGQLVKGSKVTAGKARFGSGTSFGTTGKKYGSGSLRNNSGTSGTKLGRSGTSGGLSGTSGRTTGRTGGGFGSGSLRSSGRSR